MEEYETEHSPVIMSVSKEDDGTITQVYLTDKGHYAMIKEGVPVDLENSDNVDSNVKINKPSCWKHCVLIAWFIMFYILYVLIITVYLAFLSPHDIVPYVLVRNTTSGTIVELPYSLMQGKNCLGLENVFNETNKTKFHMDPQDLISYVVNVGAQFGNLSTPGILCI